MHILLAGQWREVLDTYRPQDAYRLDVCVWSRLGDALDTRPALPSSVAGVMRYVRKVGVRRVVEKVRSRYGEKESKKRFLAVGLGRVLEAPTARIRPDALEVGAYVVFVATRHHAAQSRVVVPHWAVASWEELPETSVKHPDTLHLLESGESGEQTRLLAALAALAGTSPFAEGEVGDGGRLEEIFSLARQHLAANATKARAVSPELIPAHPINTTRGAPETPSGAVLFGWGHYARTCILPSVEPHLALASIHEIEPASIPTVSGRYRWSTSPAPDPEDRGAAAWFLAGYHHHHANLAIEALHGGVPVVVEKPLVTRREDLDRLIEARAEHPDVPLFVGFHRRHILGSWLRRDLGVGDASSPLHCHAIVHEIPLPEHHWYNWPESGSRLLANGSHWIDHFLWLNPGARVERARARRARSGQVLVELELENGACFSLALSDHGTSRGGVRELTEWHRGAHTARLIDQQYVCEREDRVSNEARLDEVEVYRAMYERFCDAILAREPGESLDDLRRTWGVMIDLEESLARCSEFSGDERR